MKILSFSGKWMARRSDSDWGHDSIVRAFAYKCEALSSIPSRGRKEGKEEDKKKGKKGGREGGREEGGRKEGRKLSVLITYLTKKVFPKGMKVQKKQCK
jgi:hypothetical protein